MKSRSYILAVALITSLFIYVFYRTERTVINEIITHVVSADSFFSLRARVQTNLPLNQIIIFSLPEALWVLCATITSKTIYIGFGRRRISGAVVPILYCISLEFCQLIGLTNGTFNLMDIALSAVFWLFAIIGFDNVVKPQNLFGKVNKRSMVCIASYGIVYLSHVI